VEIIDSAGSRDRAGNASTRYGKMHAMARASSDWSFVKALLLRLFTMVGLSLVGLAIVLELVPAQVLRDNSDSVGDYLQTLGTIYAVLQAFVVFVVWTQFNDVRTLIEREASDLIDLFRTSQALPEPLRSRMKAHLEGYVDRLLGEEWGAMQKQDTATLERCGAHLEDAFTEISDFHPDNDRDCVLFTEALARFNELSDVRTLRITGACSRVPLGLRLLLDGGAIMIVGSTWLFSVESVAIHVIITSAIAGVISHIRHIVDDLDDPFSGDWQVPRHNLERARRMVRGEGVESAS
jgi:hypothetical protein